VLVGYDGSPDAERAAAWAAAAARERPGTVLHLVRAQTLPPLPLGGSERTAAEILAAHEASERQELEAARDRFAAGGLAVEIHLRRWLAAETLLERAAESGAGLVVVGQHGHGPTRLLLGSVSGKVARGAEVPVVVTRGEQGGAVPPQRVLLAVDGSRSAFAAAAAVATWTPRAHVTAVRVLEDGESAESEPLAAGLAAAGLGPGRCELEFADGPIARTLLDRARDGDFDLLAAGRRGLSAWQGLLTGSVSEKLLLLSPCPILLAN
jgi:nucleotide-binding universal stress UspA family protein